MAQVLTRRWTKRTKSPAVAKIVAYPPPTTPCVPVALKGRVEIADASTGGTYGVETRW